VFPLAVAVLVAVFILIAVRQVGSLRLQIWQIMLLGAAAVLLSGQISPASAIASIEPDVMAFLFGMFVIGEALDQSNYLSHITHRLFSRARNVDHLVLVILFGGGIAAAFLMKDPLAIIATPVVLAHAEKRKVPPKPLLLALAFGLTIGSVMSPIGNPQNLLIAVRSGMQNSFLTFFGNLAIPTLINLGAAYLLLRLFYGDSFAKSESRASEGAIRDRHLAGLARLSLGILLLLTAVEIGFLILNPGTQLSLSYISLAAALPILVLSPKRAEVVRKIDWATLVFFASMFVMMESVWETGVFQSLLHDSALVVTSLGSVFAVSVVVSQFISNIPLVALYLPILLEAGASVKGLLALAAGSTVAGNFFILGAASNVIILEMAEERFGQRISFWEFARIGIPLTLVNVAVYWLFLSFF
jgi:Na+/H+ antiporter NhaD/arsenite permease-like protein